MHLILGFIYHPSCHFYYRDKEWQNKRNRRKQRNMLDVNCKICQFSWIKSSCADVRCVIRAPGSCSCVLWAEQHVVVVISSSWILRTDQVSRGELAARWHTNKQNVSQLRLRNVLFYNKDDIGIWVLLKGRGFPQTSVCFSQAGFLSRKINKPVHFGLRLFAALPSLLARFLGLYTNGMIHCQCK